MLNLSLLIELQPKLYFKMNKKTEQNLFKQGLLPAVALWISDLLLFPLDTVAIRIKADKKQFNNFYYYSKTLIKNEGIRRLYRGIQYTFPCSFIPSMIYFVIYEAGRKEVSTIVDSITKRKQAKLLFPFLISSIGQIAALSIQLPFDVIRTRLQSNDPEYNYTSMRQAFTEVIKKEGLSRLYISSKLALIHTIISNGILFQSYEVIRFMTQRTHLNLLVNIAVSTIVANLVCSPLDLLITRYALFDTTKEQLHFRKMIKSIIREEGHKAFYKGLTTKILAGLLYGLFWFVPYQYVRNQYQES